MKKISNRTRAAAALALEAAANHDRSRRRPEVAELAFELGGRPAQELALAAFRSVPLEDGNGRWIEFPAQWAEAALLVREGWSP